MNTVKRRLLLSLAALSPGVVVITLQEFAVSMAFLLLGLFGAIGVAAAALALSPQMAEKTINPSARSSTYTSLLTSSALSDIRKLAPDLLVIRAQLRSLLSPASLPPGLMTQDDQVAMVLSQIMARWGVTDVLSLTDDQTLELWIVERLMRASPAEAGALAGYFSAPNAMLTMRDSLVAPIPA